MKSNCCKAPMRVVGTETKHYRCNHCGMPCDEMPANPAVSPTYDEIRNAIKYFDMVGVSKDFIKGNQEGYKRGIEVARRIAFILQQSPTVNKMKASEVLSILLAEIDNLL